MKKQRGVIELIYMYSMIGAVVLLVIGGMGVAIKIQTNRLATMTDKYNTFVATTKAIGDQAATEAKRRTDADKLAKEKSDAEQKKLIADNADLGKRLRDARASSSYLPTPTPTARNPDRICFNRAQLESAIRQLDGEVSGIVESGDHSRIGLDTAKGWAQQVK